jgi:hypothetical protein
VTVGEVLRRVEPPDAGGAEARARRVTLAAFEQRGTAVRRRRRRAAAAVAAAATAAVAPARDAVGDFVQRVVHPHPGAPHARPGLVALPAGGRLLVTSQSGAWIVPRTGGRRLLGSYAGADWSPRGLFVVAWRGRQLTALEPGGRPHWSLTSPRPISRAWWSPDGYRIAYRTGERLRVVAGDGTNDRPLARVAFRAGAWRPGPDHVFAYVDGGGAVVARNADTGRQLWRFRPPRVPFALTWTPDGRRLIVAGRSRLRLLDARGREVGRIATRPGTIVHALALSPSGRRLVLVRDRPGDRADLVVLDLRRPAARPETLFSASARLDRVAWSPDGRWLLLIWPRADQWLFVRAAGVHRIVAVSHIAAQFAPGQARPVRPPVLVGWCCSP